MDIGLCVEMALTDLPFEERIRKAADLGFRHAEMWLVNGSYRGDPESLASLADRTGVQIATTVIGDAAASREPTLTDPQGRSEWLRQARLTLEFNQAARIPATIVCTGNFVGGLTDEQMAQSVAEGLKPTVELAEKAGITLLLEPLNSHYDHPGYWLTSSDRGAEICRQLASDRLRLLFDCYHMQIMEGDLVQHIERNLDVIGHFHCAGVPGRHEPCESEVDYPFVFRAIERMGYAGVFGLEYAPSFDHAESLRKTLDCLSSS